MAIMPYLNKIKPIDEDESNYDVKRIKTYYKNDSLMYDLSDDKTKSSFVDYVEKLIRRSDEYKEMIKYLREHINMNHCSYFRKVNNGLKKITIEIHHSPFTLYDITYIVLQQHIEDELEINPFSIAEEVMYMHFRGIVGLIPLSKTVHELVHAGQIFVPINNVFGDVYGFYNEYKDYMTTKQKEMLYKNINISDKLAENIPNVLKKKFVYLDVDGMTLPHKIDKIKKK